MTVIRTSDFEAGTVDPTPTAERRATAWRSSPTPEPDRAVLDLAAIRARVHPDRAHAPRLKVGIFRVPVPCPRRLFELEQRAAVHKFVDILAKQGWEMVWSPRIEWGGLPLRVEPDQYPAWTLNADRTNTPIWDQREYRVGAYFRLRNPQPLVHEIPTDRVSIGG